MTTHDHHHHHHDDNPVDALWRIAILAGLGMYFSYNIISGNLSNYINARFAWLSYLAAALFLLMAAAALCQFWRERHHDHHHDHDHHHHHDHDHSHTRSWWVLLIVAMPLILGTLIPSQPLGVEAVNGEVRISAVNISTATTLTTDPLEWNILDWLRNFNFSSDLTEFNGQEASVIGFIYREPNFPDNHFMVARFAVSCCVADSTAMGLPIFSESDVLADIQDGEWVRVSGLFEVGEFQEQTIPIMQLTDLEIVEQPAHPYLNP